MGNFGTEVRQGRTPCSSFCVVRNGAYRDRVCKCRYRVSRCVRRIGTNMFLRGFKCTCTGNRVPPPSRQYCSKLVTPSATPSSSPVAKTCLSCQSYITGVAKRFRTKFCFNFSSSCYSLQYTFYDGMPYKLNISYGSNFNVVDVRETKNEYPVCFKGYYDKLIVTVVAQTGYKFRFNINCS